MVRDHSASIKAMLRSGKMIHIGGRPVIVPAPRSTAKSHDRSYAIKLGLAFAAIYLIWGSTYLAIRYAVETIPPLVAAGSPAFNRRRDHADLGLLARVSPDAATMDGGICTRRVLLLDRAWLTALGRAICGLGADGAADRDGTDVHSGAGLDDGATENQLAQRAGPGSWRGRGRSADGRGTHDERVEPVGIAGGFPRFFVVVYRCGYFAATEAAFGCAGANRVAYAVWRGDVAAGGRSYGRVPADALVEHCAEVCVWVWDIWRCSGRWWRSPVTRGC